MRTQAVRQIVPHFEHKLFLTATPHNGYRESFSALLELLDNQRFSRGTEPDRKQLDAVMVRRLKSDPSFAFNHLGIRRFPPRVLESIEVPYTTEEREIHAALREYTKQRTSKAIDQTERFATEFVLKTLKKRLFSIVMPKAVRHQWSTGHQLLDVAHTSFCNTITRRHLDDFRGT
jgi:hypothetical protein